MFDPKLKEIAEALVAHCRAGTERQALETLYAPDAVSIEAAAMSDDPSPEKRGVEAIKAKHDWWDGATEVHAFSVEGPFLHGEDRFGVIFELDVTMKDSGQRSAMKELGLYTVAGGKIVREEFFYAT